MSDRSEDLQVERVQDPNIATVGVGHGTSGSGVWAVPPGGHPEPPSPAASDPSNAPTWPGSTVTEERPTQEHPWTSPPSDAYGFPRRDPVPPGPPGGFGSGGSDRRGRPWFLVAVVAALIGGGVGAGVTALADHNNSPSVLAPIRESTAAPGAAIDGGANIPSLVRELLPAVVSIDVKTPGEEDEGTGMIISADGMVVTNYHVIALADQDGGALTVTESGSTAPVKATLVGTDQADDVALLQDQRRLQPEDDHLRRLRQGGRRRRRRGHRQRPRVVAGLPDGHPGDRLGDRPDGHRRRPGKRHRDAVQPHPDRRGHQPGQLRWAPRRHGR